MIGLLFVPLSYTANVFFSVLAIIIPCLYLGSIFKLHCQSFISSYPLQISRNLTTNEMANAMRYSYLRGPGGRFRNPFDHGVRKNCSDFLLKGYNEDIERVEQTLQPDEELGMIQMTRSAVSQNGESMSLHANGTDHGCADPQGNSKSHRHSHGSSQCCSHSKRPDKTPLGLGLGLGRNNPSSRYTRSLPSIHSESSAYLPL
jgi:hypothetical protein